MNYKLNLQISLYIFVLFQGPSQMRLSKPVVAAVDGYAVAGGFELALWCDLRVMETSAIMGVFCRRFGVPLIDGGTVRLQALIGLSRAMDLILTGRPIEGKEAFTFGIANRLVPTGTALGQAYNLANSLVKFPQECMRVDRDSAYYAAYEATSEEDALKFEFENGKHVIVEESIKGKILFKCCSKTDHIFPNCLQVQPHSPKEASVGMVNSSLTSLTMTSK